MNSLYTAKLENDDGSIWLIVTTGYGEEELHLGHAYDADADIWTAIGKLWTAAPSLLAACKAALKLLTGDGTDGTLGHHPDNPVPAMLRAAIANAEPTD